MNDIYAATAARELLACSQDETAEFQRILREEYERWEGGETNDISGFEVNHIKGGGAFFYTRILTSHPEHLPEAFRHKLAEVLTRLGEPYLEFGVSMTYENSIYVNSEGGYYFRITDKGELVFAETVWPDEKAIESVARLDTLVQTFGQDSQAADKAQEALERLLEFWDVRQEAAIAALARYLQYRVVRFYECAHCGADLPREAVETDVGRFCSARCAELEEL